MELQDTRWMHCQKDEDYRKQNIKRSICRQTKQESPNESWINLKYMPPFQNFEAPKQKLFHVSSSLSLSHLKLLLSIIYTLKKSSALDLLLLCLLDLQNLLHNLLLFNQECTDDPTTNQKGITHLENQLTFTQALNFTQECRVVQIGKGRSPSLMQVQWVTSP